jgi:hypothetical protein
MLLQDKPGIWIPLTQEDLTRAKALLEEIAGLAQTAQGSERHRDRLTEFDMLIGFAAGCAAVAETQGAQAQEKWRAKQYSPWKEHAQLFTEAMRVAWRRLRRVEDPQREKATVIALDEHRS